MSTLIQLPLLRTMRLTHEIQISEAYENGAEMASTKSVHQKARVHKIHQHYRGALFSFIRRVSWIFGIRRSPIKDLINKALERFGEVFVFVVDHVKFAGHGWIGERDGHESAGLDFLPGHLS